MRVAIVGLGFFAQFHINAWLRMEPPITVVGVADRDASARERYRPQLPDVPQFEELSAMLDQCRPDVVDVITRPESHRELAEEAFRRHIHVISQKPIAPSWQECRAMVQSADAHGVRLLVHDNWRFQPWYEFVKQKLEGGTIGRPFLAHFRVRPGDGRGPTPFQVQPYFSQMARFFFYETGVHYIDLARYLFGEIREARGVRRQVRPDIAGEDMGLALLSMDSGAEVVLDGNRWSEAPTVNPAFGTVLIEGTEGLLRVGENGTVQVKPIGEEWRTSFTPDLREDPYRGDSVFRAIHHLAHALQSGDQSPMEGREYLNTMRAVFGLYGE